MATVYNTEAIRTSYSVDLAQGDIEINELYTDLSSIIVECAFPDDPNGSGTVYTSLDSVERVRQAIADEDDSDLTWTEWDLTSVTPASDPKLLVGYAPTAIKFENDSAGAYTVRFNFRGTYGGR